MDGATDWQEFRFIVLPHLRRYMQLGVLLGTIYILSEFDSDRHDDAGRTGHGATMNLPYLIYQNVFFGYDIGHSAAMAVIVVALTIVAVTYLLRVLGRLMEDDT